MALSDPDNGEYFAQQQQVYYVAEQALLIDSGFRALPPRAHPLEAKIAAHEAEQLGYFAIEYEGYVNVFGQHNALIGGVTLQRRWNAVAIYSFFVEPEFRGRGLGKKILATAEQLALHMGATALVLETSTLHNHQFYRNSGFRVLSEVSGYIDQHSYFYMLKPLSTDAQMPTPLQQDRVVLPSERRRD